MKRAIKVRLSCLITHLRATINNTSKTHPGIDDDRIKTNTTSTNSVYSDCTGENAYHVVVHDALRSHPPPLRAIETAMVLTSAVRLSSVLVRGLEALEIGTRLSHT